MGLNKKGYTTLMLLAIIVIGFVLLIILGVSIWGFDMVDDSFTSIDFDVGNTSFSQTYNETLKLGITSMKTTVPSLIGTVVLLGMVLMMMIVSYNIRKINQLWILLDIALIVVAEVAAFVISSNFVIFINSSPELLAIFSNTLAPSARYIIRLPVIVPVIGALVMLTTYLTKKKEEELPPGF